MWNTPETLPEIDFFDPKNTDKEGIDLYVKFDNGLETRFTNCYFHNEKWHRNNGIAIEKKNIIAWMPIPEPPKF